jgi:O-antigen ligase
MGLFLTLLYVVLNHLSPPDTFAFWATYHIMLWLGIAAIAASLLKLGELPLRAPQIYLMAGLVAAIGISRFANHWYGGVLPGVADFLTSGIVFFLVIVNVTNVARMRVIAISLAFLSVYLLSRAVYAYHSSEVLSPFLLVRSISGSDAAVGMDARIRALGFLHDPNDFGQFLVVCLPLLGLAWRRGRRVWNVVVVVFPACFLLYGIYLAHSRGALIGLMVLLGMALSKYLHPIGSLAVAGLGMLLLLAPVSGGREISFSEASTSGRLMAWGAGIGMLKSSPIFGVGYDAFQEGYEQTFWVGLIVYTLVELNHLLRSIRVTTENESLLRSGQLLRASLAAFLVSAWFLSRTYIMTFYLLISLAVALIQILKAEPTAIPTPAGRGWKLTLAVQAVSILAVYAMVRSRSF